MTLEGRLALHGIGDGALIQADLAYAPSRPKRR